MSSFRYLSSNSCPILQAAHCFIHIAALIAEYLKRKGTYPQGVKAFQSISPNVEQEEKGAKSDTGMQDVQYTEVGHGIQTANGNSCDGMRYRMM